MARSYQERYMALSHALDIGGWATGALVSEILRLKESEGSQLAVIQDLQAEVTNLEEELEDLLDNQEDREY